MCVLAESAHKFENVYNLSVNNVHSGTIIFVRVNIQDQLAGGFSRFNLIVSAASIPSISQGNYFIRYLIASPNRFHRFVGATQIMGLWRRCAEKAYWVICQDFVINYLCICTSCET